MIVAAAIAVAVGITVEPKRWPLLMGLWLILAVALVSITRAHWSFLP